MILPLRVRLLRVRPLQGLHCRPIRYRSNTPCRPVLSSVCRGSRRCWPGHDSQACCRPLQCCCAAAETPRRAVAARFRARNFGCPSGGRKRLALSDEQTELLNTPAVAVRRVQYALGVSGAAGHLVVEGPDHARAGSGPGSRWYASRRRRRAWLYCGPSCANAEVSSPGHEQGRYQRRQAKRT
jgi:hypothetical protein